MTSQKILKLYVYVDGVNDVPFYGSDAGEYEAFILANGEQYTTSEGFVFNVRNVNEQIEIGDFRYDAKRMGGASTITFTLMYEDCLDDFWSENVYAEFNGEKYFLKQTPTSSKSNDDARHKHDVELVSERVILDNVYFFDTVVGDPQGDDKPVSNSTTVTFFGDVREFVARLNASLEYAKLLKWEDGVDDEGNAIRIPNGYHVVVDDDIVTEEKLVSFEDQFFSNVLQEIYNTYEVPYYFEGKTIHIGKSMPLGEGEGIPTFSYGVDDALLSITKNNANYKVVNRVTGTGSTDNIPFYYPNNSPKGEIAATSSNEALDVTILDNELYSNEVKLDGVITRSNIDYENLEIKHLGESIYSGETFSAQMGYGGISKDFVITFDAKDVGELSVSFESEVTKYTLKDVEINDATFGVRYYMSLRTSAEDGYPFGREVFTSGGLDAIEDVRVPIAKALDGYKLKITVSYAVTGKYAGKGGNIVYDASFNFGSESGWTYDGKPIELKDVGLKVEGTPSAGDTITQTLVKYVKTSQNLMPSVYRETDGAERFYNAINYPYPKPEGFDDTLLNGYYGEDGILRNPLGEYEVEGYIYNDAYKNEDGTYIHFNNPYVEEKPKEHIITVEDIKPTIKETEVNGLRIDMFSEFAYDEGDNDETYEDEEGNVYFEHPYFYGKLRVMDFNLFDHAIEQQPMTISFTSGDAGACNFEIGVTEDYPQKNPVQVDEDGNLVRDENGMVLAGVEGTQQAVTEFQDRQQDTSKYEVWIALRKEEETYGILMPKAPKFNDAGEQIEAGHRPKACSAGQNDGDTFVILGINLPKSYILNAEKKLEAEIINYLKENNDEKFTFSISFSRIYFEENPDVLKYLNENSKIAVMYDGHRYELYVSSFSYNMSAGDVLPEIRVELDDTLKVSQNALQNAISQVKSELGSAIRQVDANVAMQKASFIQRQADDDAYGTVNFTKGIKFGEGGKVEVFDNNSAKLTIEYLEVTKKASFTSLEIKEKTHVGGQIIISPAAMTCGEVEEFDDYYRCYFQTKGADGSDEIFNQFVDGDLAICQTYNAWGSRYYWRLVVGVGEDYIDLSKVEGDYDENSDAPMAGDKIVQLGNKNDKARQAAQVLSAYGEDSPSFIMYNGINSFSLEGKNITGIIWNPETQEPQMYSYGSFFFGDRQLDGNYITFQKPEDKDEKELYISANVSLGSDSTGLSNLEEFNTLTDTVRGVQDQIDGVVENWSAEGHPYIDSFPVSGWATDAEKIAHINDTYVNIEAYVDDESTPTAGHAWRWCQCAEGTTPYFEIEKEVTSTNWEKIGKIDPNAPYTTVELFRDGYSRGPASFAFDTEIDLYGGPNVYVKVESATGDVYIKDPSKYFVGYYPIDIRFTYTDSVQVTDKDGNTINLHWHPIADSDAVRALKRVNDFEYLAQTLGKSVDVEGAVLAQTLAVKDGDDNVNAMLNGSDLGKDDTCGKLMIAAGIPATSSSGSENLENRAKEATTRVYEDGCVYTKNMHLEEGCTIGGFSITEYAIGIDGCNTLGASHGVIMTRHGFNARGTTNTGSQCKIERDVTISANSDDSLIDAETRLDTHNAFYIRRGLFAGLRPKTRVLTSNMTSTSRNVLDEFDFSVLINTTSGTCYMELPSEPCDGQEYIIESKGAGLNIISTDRTVYSMSSGATAAVGGATTKAKGRYVLRFKYYAAIQQWTCGTLQ